jgi:hypothetical protein
MPYHELWSAFEPFRLFKRREKEKTYVKPRGEAVQKKRFCMTICFLGKANFGKSMRNHAEYNALWGVSMVSHVRVLLAG